MNECVLQTRYLPATDRRGSRIVVWQMDRYEGTRKGRIAYPYDYAGDGSHDDACLKWIVDKGGSHYGTKLLYGTERGYVFLVSYLGDLNV